MAELDFGTGDPHRGSECRPCVKRVRCGVVDLGGVLERARRGVPPIGAVKSEARAGGGGLSTAGAGINSAYCQWLFVCSRGVWRSSCGLRWSGR